MRAGALALAIGLLLATSAPAGSEDVATPTDTPPVVRLGSTTSTRDSGLLDAILPAFRARTGIVVRVIAVGTGRALELGRRGDVDALLVHDTEAEERFVREGFGRSRRDVMYNDFVIVGPADDPAAVAEAPGAAEALRRIAASGSTFLSRGDDSGTHRAERRLWERAGIDPRPASGTWYRETGGGMGAALNAAAELRAYALADRGTWLSFRNRGVLRLLLAGDPPLRNPYGFLVVSPERHPHAAAALAERLGAWLVSDEGRAAIADFRVGGEPLFFPAARGPAPEPGAPRGAAAREDASR